MKTFALGIGIAIATPSAALIVSSGSGDIAASDPTQTNRVFRDATPSTWAAPNAFPGVIGGTYHFDALSVSFAANATQDVFYRISSVNPDISPFVVAYANSFDPANIGSNYLGDAGVSNSGSFEVIVAAGSSLVVVFSEVNVSFNDYSYTVEAFSDANGGEVFGVVPEPATWALMIGGFGMVGAAARRRRRTAVTA